MKIAGHVSLTGNFSIIPPENVRHL